MTLLADFHLSEFVFGHMPREVVFPSSKKSAIILEEDLETDGVDYIYQFHALFIYLIPEDALPGDSKVIGIICALKTIPIPGYTHPRRRIRRRRRSNVLGTRQ